MFELSRIMLDSNNPDREVRVLIALAGDTSTEILQKLSKDPDSEVRKAVVSNPNTPIEILEELGEEFPEIIIINPIFNLLLLENPDSRFVRLSLARSLTTSAKSLARLAETKDKKILRAIAFNVNTTFDVLNRLDINIRAEVARHPKTSLQILEKLASDKSYFDDYQSYLDDYFHSVYGDVNISANPAHYGYFVREKVAENPNSSLQILEKLASDEEYRVRREVARNPNSSLQILEKLASDKDSNVQRIAKQNLAVKLKFSQ